MDFGWLKAIFVPVPKVDDLAAVRPGRMHLQGRAMSGDEELRSPVKNIVALAFYYRAFYAVQGRTGWVERTLKGIEVHAPAFVLEMKGGKVRVEGTKITPFTGADHRELAGRGFPTFKAEEQVVRPGTRVGIKGKVVQTADGPVIRADEIHVLEEEKPQMPRRRREPSERRRE